MITLIGIIFSEELMRLKKCVLFLLVISVFLLPVTADGIFGQNALYPEGINYTYYSQLGMDESSVAGAASVPQDAVLLAMSNADYPVTPGDVMVLSYSDGNTLITRELLVDSDCSVVIPQMGVLNGSGLSYAEFKDLIEGLVTSYYKYSSPQVILKSCGVFTVRISGEVNYSQYVRVWGLSRLSDLSSYVSDTASTRAVTVAYKDGKTVDYDLFKALKMGSKEDNPLLVPGSEVIFNKAERLVSLQGSVAKPGVYQPLEGESLKDIISVYGGGLLNSADGSSITTSGYTDGVYSARTISLEDSGSYVPVNGDVYTVSGSSAGMPYITVTGAVIPSDGEKKTSADNRFIYSFVQGETAEQMIRSISSRLTADSDTDSVYILRGDSRLEFNATEALVSDSKGSLLLESGDTVVIPFRVDRVVTVTGAVNNPGTFPYVPDKTSDYYIKLAGGFNSEATKSVKTLDEDGKTVKSDYVMSDFTVVANQKNFAANLAITASVLSLIGTILTIVINSHTISGY